MFDKVLDVFLIMVFVVLMLLLKLILIILFVGVFVVDVKNNLLLCLLIRL